MKIAKFDNYIHDDLMFLNICITDITESDKRKMEKLYQMIRRFKYDLGELIKE